MCNRKFEHSQAGINAAISDFIQSNWDDFVYLGIEKDKIIGFEAVQIFVQKKYNGSGLYSFTGEIRPQLSDNQGGYQITTKRISGCAEIAISSEGLSVESLVDSQITVH